MNSGCSKGDKAVYCVSGALGHRGARSGQLRQFRRLRPLESRIERKAYCTVEQPYTLDKTGEPPQWRCCRMWVVGPSYPLKARVYGTR